MKRLVALTLLAALPCSCADVRLTPQDQVFRMSVSTGDPTRTVINEVSALTEYGVYWQSGDALGVYEVSAQGVASGKTVSDPLESGGASASFTFSFTGSPDGPFRYCFVYPDTALSKDVDCLVTIPAKQRFQENSFDPSADVLVSMPVIADERPARADVRFARLGATARMEISAPTTAEIIRRITFSTTEKSLAGSYVLNPATGEIGELTGGTGSIVLVPGASITYSGSFPVWFRLAAGTLEDNFTVKVETDEKTYTKTVNLAAAGRTLEFAHSRLTTFTVDMSAVSGKVSWDAVTLKKTGVTNTSYTDWGPVKGNFSGAFYSGYICKRREGNSGDYYLSLRTEGNSSGIVTTTSGGYVQAVMVTLPSYSSARTLQVYASNTAYTAASELFDSETRGTLIGSVASSTSDEVTRTFWLTEPYTYVGFRSKDGSMLVKELRIKWEDFPPEVESSSSANTGGWLEMPAAVDLSGTTTSSLSDLYQITHTALMNGVTQRNYTMLYDPEVYASYWVAYPLCAAHCGSGRKESWGYDPAVPSAKQTRMDLGAYNVHFTTEAYPKDQYYARGHQIPNADRTGVPDMLKQTYYATNITPQMQYGFNGGVWSSLESAVRGCVSDTVYVVTGAAFRKKGGAEEIATIVSTRDGKTLPLPNYYWKALLKVHRSAGAIDGACTIGFWLEHRDDYDSYTSGIVSVSQIEAWTGLDLFTNLPAALQSSAEGSTDWAAFQSF